MKAGTLRTAIGVSVGWVGISMISDGLPSLLLPHRLLLDGETDATTLGVATLLAIGAAALVQPFAGAWSDRVGRFPAIAAGCAAAILGLGLLLAPGGALPGTFIALLGLSLAQAGHQALLPDHVEREWHGRASGLKGAFDVGGAFVGFLLLAALLGAGQSLAAVAVLGAVLVGGFVVARILLVRPEGPRTAPAPVFGAYRLDLRADGSLLMLVAARFLFLLGIYAVGRFLVLFIVERLGRTADAAAAEGGTVLAVLALVTVVASVPSGWLADRIGRRPVMIAGGACAGAGIAMLPLATGLPALLAIGGLLAVGSAAFGAASWGSLADLVADRDAGRLLGIANLGTAGAAALAGAFGLVIDAAGYGPAFALAAVASVAGGLIGWWAVSREATTVATVGVEVVR